MVDLCGQNQLAGFSPSAHQTMTPSTLWAWDIGSDSSVGELGLRVALLLLISSVFIFSKILSLRDSSPRDLENVASAEVWLVSENNSLWR